MLNRQSFAQTVENIFACAILARDGKISIGIGGKSDIQYDQRRDCGLEDIRDLPCFWCPMGRADAVNLAESSAGRKEQQNIEMIPRIDQSTWQRLCKETSFDSFMANRKYPEYYGGETATPGAGDGLEDSETSDETSSDESGSDKSESQKRKRGNTKSNYRGFSSTIKKKRK